jgi:hypothetical protein
MIELYRPLICRLKADLCARLEIWYGDLDRYRCARRPTPKISVVVWGVALSIWALAAGTLGWVVESSKHTVPLALYQEPHEEEEAHALQAYVTGYNTVPSQTSSHPCIAASGAYICGRRDVVACPSGFRFGAIVGIRGNAYICEDRTADKYATRFDISCDKDWDCPYQVVGWTTVKLLAE